MPKNTHNANIFNLEFGHENLTLTFPFKRGTPFCIEPPLLRIFFQPPLLFQSQNFPAPPFKKRGGRELCGSHLHDTTLLDIDFRLFPTRVGVCIEAIILTYRQNFFIFSPTEDTFPTPQIIDLEEIISLNFFESYLY